MNCDTNLLLELQKEIHLTMNPPANVVKKELSEMKVHILEYRKHRVEQN
jgi:hypothetical protein